MHGPTNVKYLLNLTILYSSMPQ